MKMKYILAGILLVALVLLLGACSRPTETPAPTNPPPPTPVPCPTAEPCPTCPTCPAPPEPVVKEVPFQDLWANSAHANKDAEAFNHWNEADPQEVPVDCAKCHSTPGFQDFVGADGSAFGVVDNPAPIGTVIECVACHNAGAEAMTSVTFPSGAEINGLGPEARCMQCHQGRESKASVDKVIADSGVTDDDTVSDKIGFTNIHYLAAAATLYGTKTQGGYEYEGKTYDSKNDHVAGYNTCIGCHDPHTLQIKVDSCKTCHSNVTDEKSLLDIRMNGSLVDYNGNGNIAEGIYYEIQGLQDMLMQAMQAYGTEVSKVAVAYNPDSYPYFFVDTNGNGQVDPDEATAANKYTGWTARLAKAAYNYQVSIKDPGAFAHGGKYIIELLYDSISDLNTKLSTPIDLSKAHRIDAGHFAGSEEAFRHWDSEGEVPGTCAKCHSATGLPQFLTEGVTISNPTANGLNCATCHDDLSTFTRRQVPGDMVTFPSGAVLSFGEANDANLCIECHQGRESTVSVNKLVSGLQPDETSDKLRFLNVHYFAAGATLFGNDAMGAYQYTGETYVGRNPHVQGMDTCVDCHDVHALTVKTDKCSVCHPTAVDQDSLRTIRISKVDYDGDGNVTEGIADEISTFQEKLYAAMQAYATDTVGAGIVYSEAAYPYFFVDTNGNGTADPDETTASNGFNSWTPRLLEAAYNYQYSFKDPGAFAHNNKYIIEVLYDSLKDVGGDAAVDGMTRP